MPWRLSDLRRPGSDAERQLLVDTVAQVCGPDHGEVIAAAYNLGVGHAGKALTETQEIYGVEQIALAHAVVSQQRVDFRREAQRCLGYVLESVDMYLFENHGGEFISQAPCPEQVGPEGACARYGLLVAPLVDARLMARKEYVGHTPSLILGGTCIYRRGEQSVLERVGQRALLVTYGSRNQAHYGVGDNQGGHFASVST